MKAKSKQTVPVTTRALVQRINRVLTRDGKREQLKITRGAARQELGDYYVIDFRMNAIVAKSVDPESMARKLGVLKAYESVRDES